jgi:hypothetical protein
MLGIMRKYKQSIIIKFVFAIIVFFLHRHHFPGLG